MPETNSQRLRASIEAVLWVSIPEGVVQRGTPVEEIDSVVRAHADLGPLPRSYFAKEAPRAAVAVPAFTIAATPVTIGLWSLFDRDMGARVTDGPSDHPIEGVSWSDAIGFCGWLTEQIGEPFRLPSETEWERAARGDDTREYPWGDRFDSGCANLGEAAIGTTTPVGSFPSGDSPSGSSTSRATSMSGPPPSTLRIPARRQTSPRARPGRSIRTSPAAGAGGSTATSRAAHGAIGCIQGTLAVASGWCGARAALRSDGPAAGPG